MVRQEPTKEAPRGFAAKFQAFSGSLGFGKKKSQAKYQHVTHKDVGCEELKYETESRKQQAEQEIEAQHEEVKQEVQEVRQEAEEVQKDEVSYDELELTEESAKLPTVAEFFWSEDQSRIGIESAEWGAFNNLSLEAQAEVDYIRFSTFWEDETLERHVIQGEQTFDFAWCASFWPLLQLEATEYQERTSIANAMTGTFHALTTCELNAAVRLEVEKDCGRKMEQTVKQEFKERLTIVAEQSQWSLACQTFIPAQVLMAEESRQRLTLAEPALEPLADQGELYHQARMLAGAAWGQQLSAVEAMEQRARNSLASMEVAMRSSHARVLKRWIVEQQEVSARRQLLQMSDVGYIQILKYVNGLSQEQKDQMAAREEKVRMQLAKIQEKEWRTVMSRAKVEFDTRSNWLLQKAEMQARDALNKLEQTTRISLRNKLQRESRLMVIVEQEVARRLSLIKEPTHFWNVLNLGAEERNYKQHRLLQACDNHHDSIVMEEAKEWQAMMDGMFGVQTRVFSEAWHSILQTEWQGRDDLEEDEDEFFEHLMDMHEQLVEIIAHNDISRYERQYVAECEMNHRQQVSVYEQTAWNDLMLIARPIPLEALHIEEDAEEVEVPSTEVREKEVMKADEEVDHGEEVMERREEDVMEMAKDMADGEEEVVERREEEEEGKPHDASFNSVIRDNDLMERIQEAAEDNEGLAGSITELASLSSSITSFGPMSLKRVFGLSITNIGPIKIGTPTYHPGKKSMPASIKQSPGSIKLTPLVSTPKSSTKTKPKTTNSNPKSNLRGVNKVKRSRNPQDKLGAEKIRLQAKCLELLGNVKDVLDDSLLEKATLPPLKSSKGKSDVKKRRRSKSPPGSLSASQILAMNPHLQDPLATPAVMA